MDLEAILLTGVTKRFHTLPDYSGGALQTVADHAWGVAVIGIELYQMVTAMPPNYVFIMACLLHDAEESVIGDIPAPAKWRFPKLALEVKQAEEVIRKDLEIIN